ncbi:MAG: RNA-binding protein [Rhodomicrobiaceae bacterium]
MNFLCEEDKEKARPIRQCALSRTRSRENDLLRFVIDPEGRVVADIKRKLPGRGVWITATYEAVASSVRQKVFARAFRQAVRVDDALAATVAELLRRAALQDLALANKAGSVAAGFAKVEKALKGAAPHILIHASDASRDGCRKLDNMARGVPHPDTGETDPIMCFASAELSAALGRDNVNHAAVDADGGAGRKFIQSAGRYVDYIATRPAAAREADVPEQDQV